MTDSQKKHLYFPAWSRCARTYGWQMVGGRLLAAIDEQRGMFAAWPEPAGPLALRVLDAAEALAAQAHCAVTADHLRYGCNIVATEGRTSSSKDLTNQELNRVLLLLGFDKPGEPKGLFMDPEDLASIQAWLDPQIAERKSFLEFLRRQAPEAVLIRIAMNAFDTRDYQSLDFSKLRWMSKQVRNGRPARRTAGNPF
jgi:hypothetical protein